MMVENLEKENTNQTKWGRAKQEELPKNLCVWYRVVYTIKCRIQFKCIYWIGIVRSLMCTQYNLLAIREYLFLSKKPIVIVERKRLFQNTNKYGRERKWMKTRNNNKIATKMRTVRLYTIFELCVDKMCRWNQMQCKWLNSETISLNGNKFGTIICTNRLATINTLHSLIR